MIHRSVRQMYPCPRDQTDRGGDNIPPPVAPVVESNLFSDPAFMEHIVRVVAARMVAGASNTTPRSGGIVTIVQWVKGMREMGCMTYRGEEDAGGLCDSAIG